METIFDAFMTEVEQKVTYRWVQTQNLGLTCFYVQVWCDHNGLHYRITNNAPNGPCMMIKHSDHLDEIIEEVRKYVDNCEDSVVA